MRLLWDGYAHQRWCAPIVLHNLLNKPNLLLLWTEYMHVLFWYFSKWLLPFSWSFSSTFKIHNIYVLLVLSVPFKFVVVVLILLYFPLIVFAYSDCLLPFICICSYSLEVNVIKQHSNKFAFYYSCFFFVGSSTPEHIKRSTRLHVCECMNTCTCRMYLFVNIFV